MVSFADYGASIATARVFIAAGGGTDSLAARGPVCVKGHAFRVFGLPWVGCRILGNLTRGWAALEGASNDLLFKGEVWTPLYNRKKRLTFAPYKAILLVCRRGQSDKNSTDLLTFACNERYGR